MPLVPPIFYVLSALRVSVKLHLENLLLELSVVVSSVPVLAVFEMKPKFGVTVAPMLVLFQDVLSKGSKTANP